MDDTNKLEHIPPLGRSVEEVERDSSNAHNPSDPGEARRADDADIPPAPFTGGTSGTPMPLRGTTGPLLGNEEGADTNQGDAARGEDPTDNQT